MSHNPSDNGAGTPVTLDAGGLRAALEGLLACTSIAALRAAVGELREQIASVAAQETFPREYLLAELEQIAEARTLERARYYAGRLIRGATEVRPSPVSDLNLNRWKEYDDVLTDSLWLIERRDRGGAHSASYWGNFVPQIPYQLMRRYTRPGDWVLDPFAGSGTTLIEAQRLGRNAIGVELQETIAEEARRRVVSEPNEHGVVCAVRAGDSAACDFRALLAEHGGREAQLAILHPPYYDIIRFSDDPRDLSNSGDVDRFLSGLGQVVEQVAPALERGRYLGLVIGDKYARGEWTPLGFLAMQEVERRGFTLKSIVVKNFEETAGKRNQKELWRYRALLGGFYVFKHEYIFILRKR